MNSKEERIVSYPQIGTYGLAFKFFCENGLDIKYLVPPKMTVRTFEKGFDKSPDSICAPFKYMLGSYLEAIEGGANVLIGLGGFCRLDFFPELHKYILDEMGKDVIFVNFAKTKSNDIKAWYKKFKEINPNLSIVKLAKALPTFAAMIESIDYIEDYIRKNRGLVEDKRKMDKIYKDYLIALEEIKNKKDLDDLNSTTFKKLNLLTRKKLNDYFKIAIIGEYYTIMEPFANFYIEDFLTDRAVSIDRWINFTNTLIKRPIKDMKENIEEYSKYDMGATNIFTIERALYAGKNNYDGIIHVRSMGCTPEIDSKSVLDNIGNDFNLPILYLTYDSQTTDSAIKTRLEAFYDMLMMKREVRNKI